MPFKVIARFRLGSENLGSKYWKREEEKKCRLCRKGEETLRHIFEECEWTKGKKSVEEVLNRENPDIESILRIVKIRRDRNAEEIRQEAS